MDKRTEKNVQIKEIAPSLSELASSIGETMNNFEKSMKPILENIRKASKKISEALLPLSHIFHESFHIFPEHTRNVVICLGEHGWFMDYEVPFSDILEFGKLITDGKIDETERKLTVFFRKQISAIQKNIEVRFPHRAKILSSAFKAHNSGEYDLSIPLFLIQTDGICKDLVNKYYFIKSNKRPQLAEYIDTLGDTFLATLLHPLGQSLPISASEKERGSDFKGFNRHQIIHGDSLNYGTEINSLKAISLLNYVAIMLGDNKSSDTKLHRF